MDCKNKAAWIISAALFPFSIWSCASVSNALYNFTHGEENDRKFSREELEEKLAKLQECKARYEGCLKELEESGAGQMSLTDPDAKLMKENNGFGVGYNAQTAVDADSHLIAGFEMTNHPTDHGLLTEVASEVKEDLGVDVLEGTADKGYHDPEDMAAALENGIIPSVIQNDGSSEVEIEYEYSEESVTDAQASNTEPSDIKACLHGGIIHKCMEGILFDARVEDVIKCHRETTDSEVAKMSLQEMMAKAHEGYFVRDAERNMVICPLHMDQKKMDNRKCLSEHPFGTIKRTIGESFFLLKKMFKTEGEMALYCLSYNIRRAMTLRTMDELMTAMAK